MVKNNDCDIVVLTCDKYDDAWSPFFKLKNKYWKNCKYNTYLITEKKKCSFCETININENIWSKRVRDGLKKLKSKFVIIILEDFFIRDYVDTKRIEYCIKNFPENAACFNFEISNDPYDIDSKFKGFKIKTKESTYKCSCQAALWDRQKLINLLSYDCDPWTWETTEPIKDYDFYINSSNYVIDYGYKNGMWFGIKSGKWFKKDVVPLFKKEGIDVDFSRLGFYKEEKIKKFTKRVTERVVGKISRMVRK